MNFRNVTVDVNLLSAREREAWEHRMAGRSSLETALAMNATRGHVREYWHQAMRRLAKARPARYPKVHDDENRFERIHGLDQKLSANGRCRCGLLLPCESCLPTSRDMAESRREVD
jgi:hypothetical protein